MMALGFSAGLANWVLIGRKQGKDFTFCSDLLFWIMVSGILGARAAYVISDWRTFAEAPLTILRVDRGGLIYYGGFMASALAAMAFARSRQVSMPWLLDFVGTSLPLAHAFGRVGCFINGCCFGKVCKGVVGVTYPANSNPWISQLYAGQINRFALRSLPVHPVQLYEAACNLVIFGLLAWAYRHRRRDGWVAGLYLVTYPVVRFTLERFRGDERLVWAHLTVAQLISIATFLVGAGWLFWVWRAAPAVDVPGDEA